MIELTPIYLSEEQFLSLGFDKTADGNFKFGKIKYSVSGGWRIGERILCVPKNVEDVEFLMEIANET